MPTKTIPPDEFRLAITMAGAASAGCYTGGVMDYMFEILDLWQRAKDDIDGGVKTNSLKAPELANCWKYIPTHKVIIDAMGGTSAGGMTTTMSAIYALENKITPVNTPRKTKLPSGNLFYDSWVRMDDFNEDDKRDTFQKLWDTEDMEDGMVKSLLNSKFIDTIANRSFQFEDKDTEIADRVLTLPVYISKELQIIISHCLLRGIPLEVNFETPIGKKGHKSVLPNHTTFEHYILSHYHLNNGKPTDPAKYLWLNPYETECASTMQLSTKATGAFPVGLVYRELKPVNLGYDYIKTTLKRIIKGEIGNPDPDPDDAIKLKYLDKQFSSLTIDGGAINNEPYREVNSLLKDNYGSIPGDRFPRYGVIMIDPFPDRAQGAKFYSRPDDLVGVIPEILGTLTDQSRIKRREILENDSPDSFRSIIFPRKWEKVKDPDTGKEGVVPVTSPLACATVMAFGGLLDINFREHDYFLGRNNARNFFRYFFSLPYDKESGDVHPIHEHWEKDMIDTFVIEKVIDGKAKQFLPIIPDLNLLREKQTALTSDRYSYNLPDLPKYNPERLFSLKPAIKKRFLKIIELMASRGKTMEKLHEARKKEKIDQLTREKIAIETAIKAAKSDESDDEAAKKSMKTLEKKLESINFTLERLRKDEADNGRSSETKKWLEKKEKKSFFSRHVTGPLMKGLMGVIFNLSKGAIAGKLTSVAITKILSELEANDCLEPAT